MQIIILHGEDVNKSYERLKKFIETAKSRSWEVAYLGESSQKILDELSAVSLFGSERFFILKDYKKLTKKDTDWIKKNKDSALGNLIIYHENILPALFIKSLPDDSKIEEYKLPKLLWNFLEHIYPKNARVVLGELHKLIEKEPVEFIFTLIAKQLRDLYWVKIDPASTGFPSWKISKLKSQSSRFSESLLEELIAELAEIDVKVKTGKADIVSSLDLLIIKRLE